MTSLGLVLAAMVAVEEALAGAWAEIDGGPGAPPFDVDALDRGPLVESARSAGVPIIALVEQLRAQAGDAAGRVHRGATSQDIVDTALVLVSRDSLAGAGAALASAASTLAELARQYRGTALLARTLTSVDAKPISAVMTRTVSAAGMNWGLLAAAGVLTIIPGALVIWFVRNYIARGFALGRV